MGNEPLLIGKKAAAQALGISPRSLDNLISSGELKTRRIGRRRLISWRALQEFARSDHMLPRRQDAEPVEEADRQ